MMQIPTGNAGARNVNLTPDIYGDRLLVSV
jgi:hypothetical protein